MRNAGRGAPPDDLEDWLRSAGWSSRSNATNKAEALSLAASLHMKKIAPGMIVKGGNFGGLSCLALCLAEMFYCHRFVEMS